MIRRGLAAAVGFIGLLNATPAHAEYWSVDQLYHRIGYKQGGWWRAEISGSTSRKALSYGPYKQGLPVGDAVAMALVGASEKDNTLVYYVDVWDQARGITLASKWGYEPVDPWTSTSYRMEVLPFVIDSTNHNVEMRIYHYGNGHLTNCGVHIMNERDDKVAELLPQTETFPDQVGYLAYWEPDQPVWETYYASGYMTRGLNSGLYSRTGTSMVALFNLMKGYEGDPNAPIAFINVSAEDNGTEYTLAERTLYASDFAGPWSQTKFALKFDTGPWYTNHQFKVYSYGNGLLQQRRTKVFDSKSATCNWGKQEF